MSTILDALRKSEQERNQNKIPTLNDMAAPQEPSRWPLVLAAAVLLLTCVLGVLAYVIWSSSERLQAGANADITLDDSASRSQLAVESRSNESVSVDSSFESAGLSSSVLVSIVSYSENADLRFAIVNDKMVREGDFIQAGLKVEKILSDAVLFNQRGKTFKRKP